MNLMVRNKKENGKHKKNNCCITTAMLLPVCWFYPATERLSANGMEEKTNTQLTFEIDEKILKATTTCAHHFGCSENENHPCLAKVEDCVSREVHFVNCPRQCSYRMNYGNSVICHCPTRKEIFNNYKK